MYIVIVINDRCTYLFHFFSTNFVVSIFFCIFYYYLILTFYINHHFKCFEIDNIFFVYYFIMHISTLFIKV